MAAPISPVRRARAAHVLRSGGSWQKAADAANTTKRTVGNWTKDPAFLELLNGKGVFVAGELRVHADDASLLLDTEQTESAIWITPTGGSTGTPTVIGSLVLKDAIFCRAIFVPPADVARVQEDIEAKRFPILSNARSAILLQSALEALTDPTELQSVYTLFTAPMRESFAEWMRLWRYRSQELKEIRTLGVDLWAGQSAFADALCQHDHVLSLKSRKLGISTCACAWIGYCLRVRDVNGRAHVFSRTEKAAHELARAIEYGLDSLPEYLKLPKSRDTLREITWDAGADDSRILVAYATAAASAVEASANSTFLDEWSDFPQPADTYSSLEPTFTSDGATSLILFTGGGAENPTSDYWRRALQGDALHVPVFLDALQRPDRDEQWLANKRRTMTAEQVRTEYPQTWQEAIQGTSGYLFSGEDIDASHASSEKYPALLPGRKWYCNRHPVAWRTTDRYGTCPRCGNRLQPVPIILSADIGGAGGKSDASVLTVLDVASDMVLILEQRRFVGVSFPELQREILRLTTEYAPSPIAVEMNGLGQSVFGNLDLPPSRKKEFWTTERSKSRIIGNIVLAIEGGLLKFDHDKNPQLVTELRGYTLPDLHVTQDHIMSLAIGLGCAGEAYVKPARAIGVFLA